MRRARQRQDKQAPKIEFTETNKGSYFYNATIKPPSAITKCIRSRFSFQSNGKLEHNLVTICSNTLKVYAITSGGMEIRSQTSFNDKIIDVLAIPTAKFRPFEQKPQQLAVKAKSKRNIADSQEEMIDTNPENQPDYLFVLTDNFNCALLVCNPVSNQFHCVSRGNIAEKTTGERREPPYSIFLSPNYDFIALMLYENMIKIVPLQKPLQTDSKSLMVLSNAINVRVRHSEVHQIIPLQSTTDEVNFGILYSRMDHIQKNGRHIHQIRRELEKHTFDTKRCDLVATGQKIDFNTNSTYRVEDLAIGGFIAFDIEYMFYCTSKDKLSKNNQFVKFSRRLKSGFMVTAFVEVDQYDKETQKTNSGSEFMRYLFATETGELYMLAFHLQLLLQLQETCSKFPNRALDPQLEENFMSVEFLAGKLSNCSSLVYLDNSYLFYGSSLGDSFILKIWPDQKGDLDQPFVTIEQRFQSLAPIMDIKLLNPEAKQGQQNELMVVSGLNNRTYMNMIKQGISLKSFQSLGEYLPANIVKKIFTLQQQNIIIMQIVGYDQLLGFMTNVTTNEQQKTLIQLDGIDINRNFNFKSNEDIICLQCTHMPQSNLEQNTVHKVQSEKQEGMEVDELRGNTEIKEVQIETAQAQKTQIIVFATESSLKLLSIDGIGEKVYCEHVAQSNITHVCIHENNIVTANKGGMLNHFQIIQNANGFDIQTIASHQFNAEISATCISGAVDLVYVCLQDAPYFSVNCCDLKAGLRPLASHSLMANLDTQKINSFLENKLVLQGQVFNTEPTTMEVDKEVQIQNAWNTFDVSCQAATSITHIHTDHTDFLTMGIGNGKLVQLNCDLEIIKQLRDLGQTTEDLQTKMEMFMQKCLQNNDSDRLEDLTFWGVQISFVGTVKPELVKLNEDVVIACCDKPIILYNNQDCVEMQYLSTGQLRQIQSVSSDMQLLVFEDDQGFVHVGSIDGLQRLQIARMQFKKQVLKTLLLPQSDKVVLLLEEPNLAYLDDKNQAYNTICIVERQTFKLTAIFNLQKNEVPNCIQFVTSGGVFTKPILMVGTTFMNQNEQIPSQGRVLLLNPNTLELLQELQIDGSVNAIECPRRGKFLILGVNNKIQVYLISQLSQYQAKQQKQLFKFEVQDNKQTGTFIQDIKVLPDFEGSKHTSIVVGDMTGSGIFTYDIKEDHQSKLTIHESASTHVSIWVNCIVPLSASKFAVFDQDRNMYIFEKSLRPTSILEKYKLQLISSFCIAEEVNAASFGSLKHQLSQQSDKQMNATSTESLVEAAENKRTRSKKKNYLECQTSKNKIPEESKVDQSLILNFTEEEIFGQAFTNKINSDVAFVRQVGLQALEDTIRFYEMNKASSSKSQPCSLIYGTSEGSIGTLFQIPPLVYRIMQMLQSAMDKFLLQDLVGSKRSDYRQVKSTLSTASELAVNLSAQDVQNLKSYVIVDGDFVESLIDQPRSKQQQIIRRFSASENTKTADEKFTSYVIQMLEILRKTH